jgi:hypothetical protein
MEYMGDDILKPRNTALAPPFGRAGLNLPPDGPTLQHPDIRIIKRLF